MKNESVDDVLNVTASCSWHDDFDTLMDDSDKRV
jgi:hypothetical protein